MHVADHLQNNIDRTGSIACVGLDPRPALLPKSLIAAVLTEGLGSREAVAEAFLRFNRGLLKAIAGACAAVKPQSACYEAYGWQGVKALEESIKYAHELGIPVILDGKRNDIGSTAQHYAEGIFGGSPDLSGKPLSSTQTQWATVNVFLGADGVTPFLGRPGEHGIFALVHTSNPSSSELQDRTFADSSTVSDVVAQLVHRWGSNRQGSSGLSDVGAVVGATFPDQAKRLRAFMPDSIFLVPGYGAQGGSAKDALAGLRPDGRGVIVNSSRAIIQAWKDAKTEDFAAAARSALDQMNQDLNAARSNR
jgi:orotidine-5'-phosphate decarboxylase